MKDWAVLYLIPELIASDWLHWYVMIWWCTILIANFVAIKKKWWLWKTKWRHWLIATTWRLATWWTVEIYTYKYANYILTYPLLNWFNNSFITDMVTLLCGNEDMFETGAFNFKKKIESFYKKKKTFFANVLKDKHMLKNTCETHV